VIGFTARRCTVRPSTPVVVRPMGSSVDGLAGFAASIPVGYSRPGPSVDFEFLSSAQKHCGKLPFPKIHRRIRRRLKRQTAPNVCISSIVGHTEYVWFAVRANRARAGAVSPANQGGRWRAEGGRCRHWEEHSDGPMRWAGESLEWREAREFDSVTRGTTRPPAQSLRCKDIISRDGHHVSLEREKCAHFE
jgi:hypothetical protein